jgi:hypothetical protein
MCFLAFVAFLLLGIPLFYANIVQFVNTKLPLSALLSAHETFSSLMNNVEETGTTQTNFPPIVL